MVNDVLWRGAVPDGPAPDALALLLLGVRRAAGVARHHGGSL
ncbi:hypothetical protein [Streptomyces sp. NBC_00091]|nr:hypothetical protein [Streptomyces sp. NBC_00091]MCX5375060.1 hypothetical protein [Streptomyces sp. NBC_00091]